MGLETIALLKTVAVIGGATAGVVAATGGFGGGGPDIPSRTAEPAKRTAAPVDQPSEQPRKNRLRAASQLTRGFEPPKLGKPGLLGFTGQGL